MDNNSQQDGELELSAVETVDPPPPTTVNAETEVASATNERENNEESQAPEDTAVLAADIVDNPPMEQPDELQQIDDVEKAPERLNDSDMTQEASDPLDSTTITIADDNNTNVNDSPEIPSDTIERAATDSPIPHDQDGFKFNNIKDSLAADPDAEPISVVARLSRPSSSASQSSAEQQPDIISDIVAAPVPDSLEDVDDKIDLPRLVMSAAIVEPVTVEDSEGPTADRPSTSGTNIIHGTRSKPSTTSSGGGSKQQNPIVHFIDRDQVINDITQVYGRLQISAKRLDRLETYLCEYFKKRAAESTAANGSPSNGEDGTTTNITAAQVAAAAAAARENENTEKLSVGELELRYRLALVAFRDGLKRLESLKKEHSEAILNYQNNLEQKKQAADEVYQGFLKYRHRVIVNAEYSKTGKPIPSQIAEQWEAQDQKRDLDVSKQLLENIKLRNRVKRSENTLKEREELGEGLHMIDFEQLKIENQTFLEKIEEKNSEVEKLRKKIATMVQILTHVKEKLEFVRSENQELLTGMAEIDGEIGHHRDNLPLFKLKRDKLRKANQEIRIKSGLLAHKNLLKDLEIRMEYTIDTGRKVEEFKAKYPVLEERSSHLKRRLAKLEIEANQRSSKESIRTTKA